MEYPTTLQENEIENVLFLGRWLPPIIFDSHVHISPSFPGGKIINDKVTTPGETFNFFDWKIHRKIFRLIFPKQKYVVAAFGFPHLPDYKKDNEHLLSLAQQDDCIIPVFRADMTVDSEYINDRLSDQFNGLKMYPDNKQKKTRTKIVEVFPKNVIKIADILSKPLIIHLPNGLLGNLEELVILANEFPRTKFIVAHMGVVYCYEPFFEDCLAALKHCENIFFDTAMVSDSKVIAKAIEKIGSRRILFGSDAPFSYMRGGYTLDSTGRRRLYSQTKFNWVRDDDLKYYAEKLKEFKLIHINIVLGIKQALEVLAPKFRETAKSDIFFNNSKTLFHIN